MPRTTTNRPRASRNALAGYHQFKAENGEEHGSFEVFYLDRGQIAEWRRFDMDQEGWRAGWYWRAGFPGCLPDGEPMGPYTSSQAAYRNAQEEA